LKVDAVKAATTSTPLIPAIKQAMAIKQAVKQAVKQAIKLLRLGVIIIVSTIPLLSSTLSP
jgi:hypothetical protein